MTEGMQSPMIRVSRCFAIVYLALLISTQLEAQRFERPGHNIGHVSTQGNLIVMELDEGVLGKANMFDLAGRTLRFLPEGTRYRVENLPLQWDSDFGTEMKAHEVTVRNFAFPFSGKQWNSFVVGTTGNIVFQSPLTERERDEAPGQTTAGITVARFAQLADAADSIIDTQPSICVFFKPRMSGSYYVKELQDRVIVTWDLTEPFGNIQDFTWFKTKNLFQLTLHKDGAIEMSYQQLAAKDAIVGLFPVLKSEADKLVSTLRSAVKPISGTQSALRDVKLSVVGGLFLKVAFEASAPIPPAGDAKAAGSVYRVYFDRADHQTESGRDSQIVWTIRGFNRGNGSEQGARYAAFGPGALSSVEVSGNTISLRGILPAELRDAREIAVRAEVAKSKGNFSEEAEKLAEVGPSRIRLTGIRTPEVDLSSLSRRDGPFSIVYEAFHYMRLPNSRDLACTLIQGLGDKFDFLAYYSDFRIDNQEAGTPSNGPVGGHVTGIGQAEEGLENYCSKGRFQWEFIQPVYVGSNQMQEYPAQGAPIGSDHDITFYAQQLSERAEGKMMPYNYAMSQIGHEMGHRWAAFVSAKVGNEKIDLGPVHWDMGLQAPVAFPYQRPTEASSMGGSVWQDNQDGTFTQLDDNYYVPATGHSYLDLYLMGLISPTEVPDFFILRDLQPAGLDANGHRVFKAKRMKVTIQDVIAAEGARLPDVKNSQKEFNTGMVVVVEHGQKPSPELIERTNGIREQWMKYWEITAGHRSAMTTNP
jgi:hypothetical protein